MATTRRIWVKF